MPGTRSVSANIKELTAINNTPGRHRPGKQIIAIAYSQARKAGGPADRGMAGHRARAKARAKY